MAGERSGIIVGGKYLLEKPIAVSGETPIYRARHLDLDHHVVVTMMGGKGRGELSWVQAFRREVRVLSKLRHPNIVELLDFGHLENGEPYLVWQHVDGETVFRLLTDGPLTADETLSVLRDASRALRYAHQFGVYHLAVTPANVMKISNYQDVRYQLVDFMAGRWSRISDDAPLAPDVRVAPPEVLRGAEPTPASDIYVLGHLGWACLTGSLALQVYGEAAVRAQLSEVPWEMPELHDVPPGLKAVVERCLAKKPADRYADCAELMEALERYEESAADTVRLKAVRPSGASYFPVPGSIFAGKFEVDEVRGTGGFAHVFKARDIETNRPLALKILRPDRGTDSVEARRFVREGKLVFSFLSNPHTISVFDYGETGDGLLYIAFEYIDGRTLDELLESERRVNPIRVVKILEQCLASLSEAHGMGVLHRDIKPSNVMLSTRNGVEDWVTVLDFGIAKITSDLMDTAELTITGGAIGTPRYMAPEQIAGDPVGPESDLYSLGLVVYELLTGEPAVRGDNTVEMIASQLDPQSVMLPRSANVPVSFALIVNKLMRKDRRARYQKAGEVIVDLRQMDRGVSGEDTVDTGAR